MEEILKLLPEQVSRNIYTLVKEKMEFVEEVRLRVNRPLEISYNDQVVYGSVFSQQEANLFLSKISQFSFYMMDEQFKRGYVTLAGGHRVGLAGRTLVDGGTLRGLRDIGSFNIRVAKEHVGIADYLVPNLFVDKWLSTLIIGPPQTGKTSYLRDLARIISTGVPERKIIAQKVGIVDERSEIAGCVRGVPQMSFGTRVDVLDCCPKAEGMMMLIRSMSPDVIIADEIGRNEDVLAIAEAIHAGLALFVSVHGDSLPEIMKRPTLHKILALGSFQRIIQLKRDEKRRFIATTYSGNGRKLP